MFVPSTKKTTTSTHHEDEDNVEIDPNHVKKIRKLGSGCYKTVWLGELHSMQVAVGIPHMQKLSDEQRRSLLTEIKIMKNHPHPNIILYMGACTGTEFMIVTELLQGDIENLLKKEGKVMTLYQRLLLAKDAALGMNWLHNHEPSIIHRDLKTANLLYSKTGDTFVVKVCDFGLSDIKPKRMTSLRDTSKDGAKGTPLYMAPEVMLGQHFNEKADVYSFAMCLWEIYTCKDLFPHHSDYDQFVQCICKKGERPALPADCEPSLKRLLEDCWQGDPSKRPTFTEINNRLDEVLVDVAISDPTARDFWKKRFLKERVVGWDMFVREFYKLLGITLPVDESEDEKSKKKGVVTKKPRSTVQVTDEMIQYRCLRALVALPEKNPEIRNHVPIEWFSKILGWFGPLDHSILTRIVNTCGQAWFHGDIATDSAELRLSGAPRGTFLVRFSTQVGTYSITRMTNQGKILHARVVYSPSKKFSVNDEDQFDTLAELINYLREPLELTTPCGGSRFEQLFADSQTLAAYEPVPVRLGKNH